MRVHTHRPASASSSSHARCCLAARPRRASLAPALACVLRGSQGQRLCMCAPSLPHAQRGPPHAPMLDLVATHTPARMTPHCTHCRMITEPTSTQHELSPAARSGHNTPLQRATQHSALRCRGVVVYTAQRRHKKHTANGSACSPHAARKPRTQNLSCLMACTAPPLSSPAATATSLAPALQDLQLLPLHAHLCCSRSAGHTATSLAVHGHGCPEGILC